MAPELKRRKINPPPRRITSPPTIKKDLVAKSNDDTVATGAQAAFVHNNIQQAKNYAVAQAQRDGATGSYRIFDSPFGNFLLPVVPTPAELDG